MEVFNVNRSRVEEALGVDLIYLNNTFKAWTLVQYKMMESGDPTDSGVYRPDESFETELARMEAFRTELPDSWSVSDGATAFRLSGDGFFFKFCSRTQLVVLSDALLPGMYLPREFGQAVLAGSSGPRGGRVISEGAADRHITNTLFADLLRDGWVGTRGTSSERVADLLQGALAAGRAVVIARCRPIGVAAALGDTLTQLGL